MLALRLRGGPFLRSPGACDATSATARSAPARPSRSLLASPGSFAFSRGIAFVELVAFRLLFRFWSVVLGDECVQRPEQRIRNGHRVDTLSDIQKPRCF